LRATIDAAARGASTSKSNRDSEILGTALFARRNFCVVIIFRRREFSV
jgi:hypothetical protein